MKRPEAGWRLLFLPARAMPAAKLAPCCARMPAYFSCRQQRSRGSRAVSAAQAVLGSIGRLRLRQRSLLWVTAVKVLAPSVIRYHPLITHRATVGDKGMMAAVEILPYADDALTARTPMRGREPAHSCVRNAALNVCTLQ